MRRIIVAVLLALAEWLVSDTTPVPYRVTQAGRDALREGTEDV